MGYHKRVPRRKFHIRPANKPIRLAWCLARRHWGVEEWKRAVWTDESSFSTKGFGHRPWVIRLPEEEFHDDCIGEYCAQGRKSKMVWGAFCGTLKSDLVLIPGCAKLDSTEYVKTIMEPHLVPFWHRCCEEYGWKAAVEDNAPDTTPSTPYWFYTPLTIFQATKNSPTSIDSSTRWTQSPGLLSTQTLI